MIEWKLLPKEPWEVLEEDVYIIYLPNSNRALNATHDAMNHHFYYETEDTQYIYPYRYISHYAEMDWPEMESGPMIDECEHGKVLVCEECAKRHQPTESAQAKPEAV